MTRYFNPARVAHRATRGIGTAARFRGGNDCRSQRTERSGAKNRHQNKSPNPYRKANEGQPNPYHMTGFNSVKTLTPLKIIVTATNTHDGINPQEVIALFAPALKAYHLPASLATIFIPHFGHLPGELETTSRCIGQTYCPSTRASSFPAPVADDSCRT